MRRVVRGFWGPRQESVETLAGRWQLTVNRLTELLPTADSVGASAWRWQQIHMSGPATEFRPDMDPLSNALRAAEAADDWSDQVGFPLHLVAAGVKGWEIDVSGNGGGISPFLLQSIVIAIESPDAAGTPDSELLTLVADVWEPDFGDVSDYDVMDALEDDAGFSVDDPAVGWVGYLSPRRAALVPAGMTAVRKELTGGGALLEIASREHTEAVVQANLRLRDAGALQPLPRPMDRAAL
ncbi:hypothetical protein ACFU5O_08760 [Streptomyces sp. NPDC057445]|uniref:hypothetical protein n=1 Tax=Streptomyces sp. NPDC057445 TaxID=3346136 RepID=UPI00369D5468